MRATRTKRTTGGHASTQDEAEENPLMAIYKTTNGYTTRWYDVDGRERQRTYKGHQPG